MKGKPYTAPGGGSAHLTQRHLLLAVAVLATGLPGPPRSALLLVLPVLAPAAAVLVIPHLPDLVGEKKEACGPARWLFRDRKPRQSGADYKATVTPHSYRTQIRASRCTCVDKICR